MNLKKELTVRAKENAVGIRPPAFKVYKELPNGTLHIPRFFKEDTKKFTKGHNVQIQFKGILRPHQKEALNAFNGNGVLCLPCGQGKTCTALAIAAKMKRKTIIIVHKEFLANQWRDRIHQFCPGSKIGRIQGDCFDTDGEFVIAMIQTLCVRDHDPEQFSCFGMLIVDESHHIGAPAFCKTMFKVFPEFTLGLTATPDRKDGLTKLLYWFLGKQFYSMTQSTSDVNTIRIDFDHPSYRAGPILTRFGKISMAHMVNHIVELHERNELILMHVKNAIERNRRILILSDRRGHCEWFYDQLGDDVSGLYLGGMSEEKQEKASQKQVIVATFSLAYEGLDIPELDTLFLVTPHSDVKQAVGRITRTSGTKEVYDVVDNWSVFSGMFYRRKKSTEVEECLFSA